MRHTCPICVLLVLLVHTTACQDWMWVGGNSLADTISTANGPGARSGSSTWKDENGNVWLFGGKGFSDVSERFPKLLNDLWTYDIRESKWKRVDSGSVNKIATGNTWPSPRQLSTVCGVTNITMTVFGGLDKDDHGLGDTWVYFMEKHQWLPLSKLNNYTAQSHNKSVDMPGARGDMASWCQKDGLYIFGGMDDSKVIFNDMWKFSLKHLKWSEIKSSEVSSTNNYPLGRNGATSWVGKNYTLYMFGGNIKSTNIRNRHLNMGYSSDMWKYFVANNTWVYLNGHRSGCQVASYGHKREPSVDNHPGCRRRAAAWIDSNWQLWMYGGDGTDTTYPSVFHTSKLLADLWYYNSDSNMWIWFAGSREGNAVSKYFWKHHSSNLATPGGRYEAIFWLGSQNKFYLFGGLGHDQKMHDGYMNDMWVMDVSYVVAKKGGYPIGMILLFVILAISLVLTMAGLYLYARDMRAPTLWNRLDHNIKYSKLTTSDELD